MRQGQPGDPADPDPTDSDPRDPGSGNRDPAPGEPTVIDMGAEPEPQGRPVPWRAIAAAAVLVIVAAGGYFVGDRHGRTVAKPAPTPTPTQLVKPVAGVSMTGRRCSVQIGKQLVLGVEVTNDLDRPLMLRAIEIGLPMAGLTVKSKQFGTCGSVGGNTGPQQLAAGNSTWISATFDVNVPCPQPYPVLFVAGYDTGSGVGKTVVGGFQDLGDVPYSGCTASGG